jgi:hypothetical protein
MFGGKKQERERMTSSLQAAARVLEFLRVDLGYPDEVVKQSATEWAERRARRRSRPATVDEIDMIRGVRTIADRIQNEKGAQNHVARSAGRGSDPER